MERFRGATMTCFLQEFDDLSLKVEEANTITRELWPDEGLEFTVEATQCLERYEDEVPECIVKLRRVKGDPPVLPMDSQIRRSTSQELSNMNGSISLAMFNKFVFQTR